MTPSLIAHAGTQELASWTPLAFLGILLAVIVTTLVVAGRSDEGGVVRSFFVRGATGMERVTGMPGWAASTVGLALLGLLCAGIGFFNDVAWHVDLGRDEELFTAPHTMIVIGLLTITAAALLGIVLATLTRVETGLRWRSLRVPWSTLPLGLLGTTAISGFPLDELWHARFGIDVTMWSPTHLLMILGAALSPLASWLVLAEAGVSRATGGWAKALRVLLGVLTLAGLTAILGEFEFGVPQFQQLYHPVLIALAAGFGFVLTRLVLGPGRTFALVAFLFLLEGADTFRAAADGDGHAVTRSAATFVAAAAAVELAALVVGTANRVRFALAAAAGVATLGLAGEWLYNQGAHQPWTTALLPDAVLVGGLAALGAAVLATALAAVVNREPDRPPVAVIAVAGLAVVVALVLPFPRRVGEASAHLDVEPARGNRVDVTVTLDPPDAADDARWFQAIAWQGGGLVLADMEPVAGEPGRFSASQPLPVGGDWKAMVRLHRGAEMMALPVFLPADAESGAVEIPAEDRTAPFEGEGQYLMREHDFENGPFAAAVYALLALVALLWIGTYTWAAARIWRLPPPPARDEGRREQEGEDGSADVDPVEALSVRLDR